MNGCEYISVQKSMNAIVSVHMFVRECMYKSLWVFMSVSVWGMYVFKSLQLCMSVRMRVHKSMNMCKSR